MKLKLEQISNAYKTLTTFSEQKLPIKLSYKLMKVLTSLEKEVHFFQEKINDLILECSEKDEIGQILYTDDGENIQLQKDKIEQFNQEYKEITEMEVDVEDFSFTLEELDCLEISPKELYAIESFITE